MSSGQTIDDKDPWWWNEEAQESIQRKRLMTNGIVRKRKRVGGSTRTGDVR